MPIGNTSSSKSISSAWDYLSICQFDACRKSNRLDTWLTFDLSNSSGQIATSVTPALTDRVTTSERPSKRFRSENVLEPPRSERGPDPLDKSGTIPSQLGTFVHQWGTQNFQSDVAPEVSAETQTKSVCFKIGRQPEKFISSSVLQIMKFKHPQLEHLGHHLWVSHPLARFSSNQFDAIRHGTLLIAHCSLLMCKPQTPTSTW